MPDFLIFAAALAVLFALLSFPFIGRKAQLTASPRNASPPPAPKPTPAAKPIPARRAAPPARKIYGSDMVALVAFNDRAYPVAAPAKPDADWLPGRIHRLPGHISGRCTNIAAGIKTSVDMLEQTPNGRQKRIVLLSDGGANADVDRIIPEACRARANGIKIDCIAFGPTAPTETLKRIASASGNGKMIAVNSLRGLTDALVANDNTTSPSQPRHHAETTVYCIDTSGSMTLPMPDDVTFLGAGPAAPFPVP